MRKKSIISLSLIVLLITFSGKIQSQQKKDSSKDDGDWYWNGNRNIPGTWTAMIKKEKLYMQFAGRDWNTGRKFLVSEFSALPMEKDGQFSLTRESGTLYRSVSWQ